MSQQSFLSKVQATSLTRKTALKAYQRVKDLEKRESERNRQILVQFFGGYATRQHNHIIGCETGSETPEVMQFEGQAIRTDKLAKLYEYRQKEIWAKCTKLSNHFAKFF